MMLADLILRPKMMMIVDEIVFLMITCVNKKREELKVGGVQLSAKKTVGIVIVVVSFSFFLRSFPCPNHGHGRING